MSKTTKDKPVKPKTKRASKPKVKEVELVYWENKDKDRIYEWNKFVYEVSSYKGDNRRFELIDCKNVNSDTILKPSDYIQHKGFYEMVSRIMIGAPLKWLEGNKFVKV